MAAAAAAAARSFLRSGSTASSLRGAAARAASRSGPAPLPRRLPASAPRLLRSPLEVTSFCVESLMPMHSATASALMTSLLAAPACKGFGWLSEAGNDDV